MRKRIILALKLIVIILNIVIASGVIISQMCISVMNFKITSDKISEPVRIIQLTDLHNMSYGTDNIRLIKKINELNPDIVCMVGDMLNRDEKSLDVVLNLIFRLTENCKVFYSLGNHETEYEINFMTNLKESLEEAGAVVLNNEYQKVEINNGFIYIGGISNYGLIEPVGDGSEYEFMKKFENIDGFKMLLCHMPAGMLLWRGLEIWNIDLCLSGHEHGGQIRIPGIGGLYSQDEGFFPEYVDGKYEESGHTLILSRGLGSGGQIIPRFNNIPEIVCIDLS